MDLNSVLRPAVPSISPMITMCRSELHGLGYFLYCLYSFQPAKRWPPPGRYLLKPLWEISNFGDVQLRLKNLKFVGKNRKKETKISHLSLLQKNNIYLFLQNRNYYHCSYDPNQVIYPHCLLRVF